MNRTIVTSGVDSEYVLSELCRTLRSRGHEVIEFDFGKVVNRIEPLLRQLVQQNVVYITSAHINLSLRVADRVVPDLRRLYPNYLAPVEIIPILRPSISMLVPHDLLTPYGDANLNEHLYLDLFDYILATMDAEQLQATLGSHTQAFNAGWIKYTRDFELKRDCEVPRTTLFISMIGHLRSKYGVAGMVQYLKPLLVDGIQVKLPDWHGVEQIEEEIRKQTNARVIPSSTNSIELIQTSDVVICNTVSSILAESCLLGIPCICILDNEGYDAATKQEKLRAFPQIVWHPYSDRQPISPDLIIETSRRPKTKQIQTFNFQLVEQLIQTNTDDLLSTNRRTAGDSALCHANRRTPEAEPPRQCVPRQEPQEPGSELAITQG